MENDPIWLRDIYALTDCKEYDDAIDILFEYIDELLLANNFTQANEHLKLIDFNKLDINLTVAVLSIAFSAKEYLEYDVLIKKARERLAQLDPERVERLLEGFIEG